MCAASLAVAQRGVAEPRVEVREQTHRALPVLGRGTTTLGGRLVVSDVERALPEDTRPALSAADAVSLARPFTRVPLRPSDAKLVVHAGPRGAALAYVVAPRGERAGGAFASSPRIVVDATSGRVLEAAELRKHARALVFAQNPVKTPAPELLAIPASLDGPRLSSPSLHARSCIDRGGAAPIVVGGTTHAVRVCAFEQVAAADEQGDFVAPPLAAPVLGRDRADPFAEASAFFHAARALDLFAELGGAPPPLGERPLDLITGMKRAPGLLEGDLAEASSTAAELVGYPVAFYLPGAGAAEGATFRALYGASRGAVWLGQGSAVDLAYDGDVVAHEVTHAVVDATLRVSGWRLTEEGSSASPEAIGEALADYFAAALAGDPVLGEHVATEPGAAASLRAIDGDASCPSSITGEPHQDSLVLSGALWRTRRSLAEEQRRAFDAAVYRALFLSPGRRDLGFEELAAFVSTMLTLSLPHARTVFELELARRGVAPRCSSVVSLVSDEPLRSASGAFIAPGTADVAERIAPGVLQVRVDVPANAARAVVSFSARETLPSPIFGREGTSFRPLVLASWGAAVRWTRDAAGELVAGASAEAPAEGGASRYASFDIPPGIEVAYFQIANEGQLAGMYDGVQISFEAAQPSAGDGGAGVPPSEADASPIASRGSGCGAGRLAGHVGAFASPVPLLFVGAVMMAWALRVRRRAGR